MLKDSDQQKLKSVLLISGALLFLVAPFIYFPLIKPANTLVMLSFVLAAISVIRSNTPASISSK